MSKPIKQCSTCVHFVEPEDPNLCLKCDLTKEQVWRNTGSFCKVYEPSYKYTHADSIRAMTDEELAEYHNMLKDDNCCPNQGAMDCRESCEECWLKWLKEEVEE